MNRRFFAILSAAVVLSLAGCTTTSMIPYPEADMPQATLSNVELNAGALETTVTTSKCDASCQVWGEWVEGAFAKIQSKPQDVQINTPQKVVIGEIPPETSGTVRIVLKNKDGRVQYEKVRVEIISSQPKVQTDVFKGFVPRLRAPTTFKSKEDCRQAALAGAFDYYVPTLSAKHPIAGADGKKRVKAKLDRFYCLDMITNDDRKWVVAAANDQDFIWEGDKIVGHAKCLNKIFESDPLYPPSTRGANSGQVVPTLKPGDGWDRKTAFPEKEVKTFDGGRTAGLIGAAAVVACIIWCGGGGSSSTSSVGGGPGVTTGGNPLVTTLP